MNCLWDTLPNDIQNKIIETKRKMEEEDDETFFYELGKLVKSLQITNIENLCKVGKKERKPHFIVERAIPILQCELENIMYLICGYNEKKNRTIKGKYVLDIFYHDEEFEPPILSDAEFVEGLMDVQAIYDNYLRRRVNTNGLKDRCGRSIKEYEKKIDKAFEMINKALFI